MAVVIDCNIIVMCLTSRSPYHLIYKSLAGGKYTLATSLEILLEYEEIIQVKYGVTTASSFIALLKELSTVEIVQPYFNWNLMTVDPDDNKYVDCAVAGKAEYIVSEDRHFAALQNISFPNITVIGIDDFIDLLK